jgi:hypothetical protein
MMSERRETTVNVERPPPTQTVYKEPVRESSSTGVLVGIILAILVVGVIAFMLWPANAPDTGTDTDVTIETPASPPAPAPDLTTPEPAPPPAAAAPEPATPPADTVPELSAPAPETTPEPAPAPAPAQ